MNQTKWLGTWWRHRSTEHLRAMVRSGAYGPQYLEILEELRKRKQ